MDTCFKPVTQRHDKVIIVAGGHSLCGFDLKRLEDLKGVVSIAVNGAYHAFCANYWITIDPNGVYKKRIINLPKAKTYRFVGFKECFPFVHNLRRFVIKAEDGLTEANSLLCEDKSTIQTHNSGYAALNLAYHFDPKKILVLGVDADHGPHFYDNVCYPKGSRGFSISLSKIPLLFEKAMPQLEKKGIQVVNGSTISQINCLPKMSIEDGLDWILK